MALVLVQPGIEPAGQFDLAANQTITGGEIGVFDTYGTDADGFQIVKVRLATSGDTGPFYLLDEGTKGYGTLVGDTVVKTDTGFASGLNNGVRLGPATHVGSGKVTLWNKQGIYAVTLDSLADTEAALKSAAPGTGLTFDTTTGKLLLGNASPTPLAYVIQFKQDEALVTTLGSVVYHEKLIIQFNPCGQA